MLKLSLSNVTSPIWKCWLHIKRNFIFWLHNLTKYSIISKHSLFSSSMQIHFVCNNLLLIFIYFFLFQTYKGTVILYINFYYVCTKQTFCQTQRESHFISVKSLKNVRINLGDARLKIKALAVAYFPVILMAEWHVIHFSEINAILYLYYFCSFSVSF